MMDFVRRFWPEQDGGVAMVFAFAAPVLLMAGALAVDSATLNDQKSRIQSVADSTALAVAKELHLLSNYEQARAAGVSRAESLLAEVGLQARPHEVAVAIDRLNKTVKVEIELVGSSFLPPGVTGEVTPLTVEAHAESYGNVRLCVLGLNRTRGETVMTGNGAVLTAPDCAVQSNSADANSLVVKDLSTLVSVFTCTSGGYTGALTAFLPPPETDCPQLADPLADRLPPAIEDCKYTNLKIAGNKRVTLDQGTYCGGIRISNRAVVTLNPGVYVITGGTLAVSDDATLTGENVGFFFADDAATLVFENNSLVELGAPKDGAMAGLLFFENPSASPLRQFTIRSSRARKLLGTIYLPKGILRVDGSNTVGALSAYTVVVANQIDIRSATLVINADYGATDVPVPVGLGPSSGQVRMVR